MFFEVIETMLKQKKAAIRLAECNDKKVHLTNSQMEQRYEKLKC